MDSGAGGHGPSFIPLILIFAIMYFLLIRPQQKKMKEHQAMVEAVRRGDQVVTSGRADRQGRQRSRKATTRSRSKSPKGVKVRVVKSTIAQVLNKTEPAK